MILVDAHVHIYDCFDLKKFFEAAYSNFSSNAEQFGNRNDFNGTLLLTETSDENWFTNFFHCADGKQLPIKGSIGDWKFYRTNEKCSLIVRFGDSKCIILIAGRQIVSSENLEVLALGMPNRIGDKEPLCDIIKRINGNGGLAVIPWGFGKWAGKRGRILNKLLNDVSSPPFYLGDNSGRPTFLPRPSLFRKAEKKGIRILPGSDPLPLAMDFYRVGRFGFMISETISFENPANDLKQTIMNSNIHIQPYGSLELPNRFFCNQIKLRLKPYMR
jgi:hypothetical protein